MTSHMLASPKHGRCRMAELCIQENEHSSIRWNGFRQLVLLGCTSVLVHLSSNPRTVYMPLTPKEIDEVVNGTEQLDPPTHSIPADLLQFAKEKAGAKDPIAFWASMDTARLDKYLTYTSDTLTPERKAFHRLAAHQANLVLPFLERKHEFEVRKQPHNPKDYLFWSTALQNVRRTLSSVYPEAAPRRPMIDIDPPRKKAGGKHHSSRSEDSRPAPKMPMRIALPFLEAINGLFIQEFDETELSYLFHQLTGYSKTNMSKYRKAGLSPVDREDLIKALEGIIRSIKGS